MSRLMIVTRYFPPIRNAIADHSMLLVKCLQNDFEEIIVVHEKQDLISSNSPEPVHPSDEHGIRYVPFGSTCSAAKAVFKAIDQYQPDSILLQYIPHMWGRAGVAPKIALLVCGLRIKTQTPIITFVHETYYDWSPFPKRLAEGAVHRLQLLLIGVSSNFIFVTNEVRRKLLSRLWDNKIARIPAGNVSGRKPELLRQRIHPWPYILWFGTLSEGQRLEELCAAFCRVAPEFPALRLILVGGFDTSCDRMNLLRNSCTDAEVASRIIIRGFAEDDELSDLVSSSVLNVHVNSSGPSGRRTVVAAYLRSGRPMVCFDGKETDPEFRHMENVILVPDANHEALAHAFQMLLCDVQLANRLGNSARILFEERYSDVAIRRMILSHTDKILAEVGGS